VTEESSLEDTLHTEENHITVAFGSGIVGTVALTKTPINIKDAYQVIISYIYFKNNGLLRCTVVERRSLTGELSLSHA